MQFFLALGTHSMSILKNHLKNINRSHSLEVASMRMGMYIFSYIFMSFKQLMDTRRLRLWVYYFPRASANWCYLLFISVYFGSSPISSQFSQDWYQQTHCLLPKVIALSIAIRSSVAYRVILFIFSFRKIQFYSQK